MRGVINLGEVLEIEVGVDLRGADVGVAEQFLYGTQVAGGFQQMTGEGVTQQMRMHAGVEAALPRPLP